MARSMAECVVSKTRTLYSYQNKPRNLFPAYPREEQDLGEVVSDIWTVSLLNGIEPRTAWFSA